MSLADVVKGQFKFGGLTVVDGKAKVSGMYDSNGIDVELSFLVDPALILGELVHLLPDSVEPLAQSVINAVVAGLLAGVAKK
jgi:hypothetical protein